MGQDSTNYNKEEREESYRNTGRTTRLIGLYIDDLFTYGKTNEVRDHYKFGEDHKANVLLFDKIINRLYHEHQSFYKLFIKIDRNNLTFSLSKEGLKRLNIKDI